MKKILNDTQLFSKNIKYLRLSNKLTQEQFAKLFNKSHAAVAMWESGTRSPITADLLAIAEHFNVQPVDLISQDISTNYSPTIKRENVTERESALLNAFRTLTADQQKSVIMIVEGMANNAGL